MSLTLRNTEPDQLQVHLVDTGECRSRWWHNSIWVNHNIIAIGQSLSLQLFLQASLICTSHLNISNKKLDAAFPPKSFSSTFHSTTTIHFKLLYIFFVRRRQAKQQLSTEAPALCKSGFSSSVFVVRSLRAPPRFFFFSLADFIVTEAHYRGPRSTLCVHIWVGCDFGRDTPRRAVSVLEDKLSAVQPVRWEQLLNNTLVLFLT